MRRTAQAPRAQAPVGWGVEPRAARCLAWTVLAIQVAVGSNLRKRGASGPLVLGG